MRLIDADELMALYESTSKLNIDYCSVPVPVIKQNIQDMPTRDVEGVTHGEWKVSAYRTIEECSICGKYIKYAYGTAEKNYCPHCGAKMDGGKE